MHVRHVRHVQKGSHEYNKGTKRRRHAGTRACNARRHVRHVGTGGT